MAAVRPSMFIGVYLLEVREDDNCSIQTELNCDYGSCDEGAKIPGDQGLSQTSLSLVVAGNLLLAASIAVFSYLIIVNYYLPMSLKDNCTPNPCLNNGSCVNANPSVLYTCTCNSGFSGKTCQNATTSQNGAVSTPATTTSVNAMPVFNQGTTASPSSSAVVTTAFNPATMIAPTTTSTSSATIAPATTNNSSPTVALTTNRDPFTTVTRITTSTPPTTVAPTTTIYPLTTVAPTTTSDSPTTVAPTATSRPSTTITITTTQSVTSTNLSSTEFSLIQPPGPPGGGLGLPGVIT